MEKLAELYDVRFSAREREVKDKVWLSLCRGYFQRFVGERETLLEVACGFGEFSRHIRAARKIAIDLNPESKRYLPPGVEFHLCGAEKIAPVADATVDVCFASNFFEHLPTKSAMDQVLREMHRVLRPGGRLILMQPNIKYCGDSYWDFYDHHLPLSHLSAAEGLRKNGFRPQVVVPKFVPFSTKSPYPKLPSLIRLYLMLPIVWKLLGKQFVIVAEKT
jgi:ubiquinone/menaquinone biosynthesis C-methylase UbiE